MKTVRKKRKTASIVVCSILNSGSLTGLNCSGGVWFAKLGTASDLQHLLPNHHRWLKKFRTGQTSQQQTEAAAKKQNENTQQELAVGVKWEIVKHWRPWTTISMFLTCSGQAFTSKDSENENRWSAIPSHHFPFPCLALRPSCDSYHLSNTLEKKGHSSHVYGLFSQGRPQSFVSSSCLNPRDHAPYSSMPVTCTSHRHGLAGKEWPCSPFLAMNVTLLYLLLWLTPTALLLGLPHTYTHTLSLYVYAYVTVSYGKSYAFQ